MPTLTMMSPLPVYLDEQLQGSGLAARPATLAGKVVGLLPNWRPSAVEILRAIGAALDQRFGLKGLVLEQPMREIPISKGRVIDGTREMLDGIAQRVDVAVIATGDWGSCTTWCSHVAPALESRGVPTVMIVTDTFAQFGRRIASTEGCPYVMIAQTPNPIRQLDDAAIHARVDAMLPSIVDGLTVPVVEIERRMNESAAKRTAAVVRSSVPV